MDTDCDIECDLSEVAGEEIIDNVEFDDMNTDLNICSADSAEVEYESTSAQTDKFPMLSLQSIMFNAAAILFYTGLSNYTDFTFVLASLGPCAYHLNYLYSKVDSMTISVENQLLLTLMKLRRHKTNFELGLHFGISEKTVLNVWITWVNFMYRQWSELDNWPERDLVHYFCPSDFKSKFPSTRIIIDGTECPIQKPKRPIAQQSTYSTYKNRNTIKILVGSTPGGLVSYVSPAYGGSTSDRQIVERSGLTVMCDPGDSIMADKGFNVQDIFAPKDVTINMPTFFSKKNRMSGKTVMRDRKISSKRVHIERIIGLAKTFKILTEPLNSSETKLATEITTVCFMLCSFKKCIVPTTC
ncbi:uncharacterized protein LOC124115319 [Haliotis rufescens]|uniref:uncharacterized protein LOC124115319 n=1 Tax=Haliotis rufescens TaxID=6454 RepID=UPI001EAFD490|nr:uncharacterized protein LOC124115319 [Haliotis rufescens]